MAKASKRKRKKNSPAQRFVRPTAQREAHNDFDGAGAAVRVKPPILTLYQRGKLTAHQFDALWYYREQALRAQDDARASGTLDPGRIMGGASCGGAIPITLLATPAMLETSRIERDMGPLLPIARFIAVEDQTLTQWCIHKHGGRERYDGAGKFIAIVPLRERHVMKEALCMLKESAARISP